MEQLPKSTDKRESESQNTGMLIVVTGPTAAGKDTLGAQLLAGNQELNKITSYTTRPPREGEVDGIHYNFTERPIFEQMAEEGEFIMVSHYGDSYYGTPKRQIAQIVEGQQLLWTVSIETAGQMKDIIDSAYDPEMAAELQKRLLVLFVGVERLTVLKDRYADRNGNTAGVRERLRGDWEAWKLYESQFPNILINSSDPRQLFLQAQQILEEQKAALNSLATTQ